jgi:hypothetical protein
MNVSGLQSFDSCPLATQPFGLGCYVVDLRSSSKTGNACDVTVKERRLRPPEEGIGRASSPWIGCRTVTRAFSPKSEAFEQVEESAHLFFFAPNFFARNEKAPPKRSPFVVRQAGV